MPPHSKHATAQQPQRTCAALAVAEVGFLVDAPPHKQRTNVLASHLHWLPALQQDDLQTHKVDSRPWKGAEEHPNGHVRPRKGM